MCKVATSCQTYVSCCWPALKLKQPKVRGQHSYHSRTLNMGAAVHSSGKAAQNHCAHGKPDQLHFCSRHLFEYLNHAGNFWRAQLKDASVPNSGSVWQPCIGALTIRYPSDTEPFEGLWFLVSRLGMGSKRTGRDTCNMHPHTLRCANMFQNSTACH